MVDLTGLQTAFKQSSCQFAGHGRRNIEVLKKAFEQVDPFLESDVYGSGKIIEDFQDKMAALLGKESAVFFPSGTMAQQIALRVWCDKKGLAKVAYHPLSHLEIHEEDGLKELHKIKTILLADKTRVIDLKDIVSMEEDVACVLLELPQREIGGQLPNFETLVEISRYCKLNGIKLHLDGARLLEVLPFYEKTAKEVCDLFDSIYLSFYKGIGGIAGAVLAGEEKFIKESKVWKRRYEGDLISLYPYIISADYYFQERANNMGRYYEHAKELACFFNNCPGVSTVPEIPVSNMFHVHFSFPIEAVEPLIADVIQKSGVGITNHLRKTSDSSCYFEMSLGDGYAMIPKEKVEKSISLLRDALKEKSAG
ncbi:threonine aldolase family protein [Mesobacillus subterraneus]|uniref:Low specificity L-threonine aldolase n=1 Tax=Mesobacillus subterraneus TaxID=285983 RepID=A0A3R9KU19_9BACI|nr:beta-eliminating lyase-related protein [Mesobacillus subterraneus]RSD26187.1 low specificity L-threonine aldolase [Mesobacillus subterraneus]